MWYRFMRKIMCLFARLLAAVYKCHYGHRELFPDAHFVTLSIFFFCLSSMFFSFLLIAYILCWISSRVLQGKQEVVWLVNNSLPYLQISELNDVQYCNIFRLGNIASYIILIIYWILRKMDEKYLVLCVCYISSAIASTLSTKHTFVTMKNSQM